MPSVIAAIDQGTTSTRCILFDRDGPVASHQLEHKQIYPKPGWVEHDASEVLQTYETIAGALANAKLGGSDIAALGLANQRETTVVWNKQTGKPYCNAIVWQDTRTRELCQKLGSGNPDRFRNQVGLPLATYFSGPKLRWILDSDPQVKRDADRGEALFGTIDTWLIWNLTGGNHVTDVTNASRTMLMNLKTLEWDDSILQIMGIPRGMLPKIVPNTGREVFGTTRRDGPLGSAVPIGGVLGDQQAALVGHTCFAPGEMKNTYGTGCFMLLNTGDQPVQSWHGLLTTVAYQFEAAKAVYALEGSVAVAGALVQWMRDNLGMISGSDKIEALARTVPDNGGVFFVPAFSGLFAPWWRGDARGLIAGLSQQSNKGHIARAILEATAYQTLDVLDAMRADANVAPKVLKADGGMTANELLMQFQADLLGVPVARSAILQTTALGAAYAAGLSVGYWSSLEELRSSCRSDRTWQPSMEKREREERHRQWLKAIQRSQGWLD